MKNHTRFFRYLAYTLEIFVLFLLESTPNLIPELWGIKPTLLIPAALMIALFEKETTAMWFGVVCGLLADFSHSTVLGFFALLLAVSGYVFSELVTNLFKTNLFTALLLGAAAVTAIFLLQWFFFYVCAGHGQVFYALWRHYLPRALYTAVTLPVAYYFNRALAVLLHERF